MTVRLSSLYAVSRDGVCQIAAAAALAFVLTGASGAQAASADATASAPAAASAPLAAGSQYTVRPGQSLNDVAVAATQSHDRATLARASKALFDANPGAFMSHDPSRLRLGAVLTVPELDATGAAVGASGAVGASSAASAAASATTGTTATTAGTAGGVATALGAASQSAAAPANTASAAVLATPAVTGPASAPLQASSAAVGAVASANAPGAGSAAATVATGAVAGAASSPAGAELTAASAAMSASAASGAHVWTGAIQPSASAPVAGASAALASPSATASAGQAPTQVSSLQQLLALKNRVLMELQKHGIGGKSAQPSQAGGAATAGGQAAAAAGSGSPGINAMANSHAASGGFDLSPENLGFAAAIGAAAVALLAALGLRRRKNRVAAADVVATPQAEEMAGPETVMARDNVAPHEGADTPESPVFDEHAAREDAAPGSVASEIAEREAAEREAAAREAAEHEAAEREIAARKAATQREQATGYEPAADEAASHEVAAREAATQEAVAREAATQEAAAREATAHEAAHEAAAHEAALRDSPELPTFPASEPSWAESPLAPAPHPLDDATAATSHAASAEPGADALPLPAESVPTAEHPADQASADPHQWNQAPESHPSEGTAEPLESYNPPQPQINFGASALHGEPQAEPPFSQAPVQPSFDHTQDQQPAPTPPEPEAQWEQPTLPDALERMPYLHPAAEEPAASHFADTEPSLEQPSAAAQTEPSAPSGFPREAVDAFGSLELGLPPRVEPAAPMTPPASLSTQPVVEPEITTQQAVSPQAAEPRHAAEEIAAGTAGSAAVAGLGAARFGALNLDFDLELPPSPAQPLPTFTPQDLVRIARNKLDLASEYIELGDLAGARALIHEVIEANDDATRAQARALLSTLAPLS